MQIKMRGYPHPVLSHFGDDILDSVFMPVVTVKPLKNAYAFDVVFKTNNEDLLTLVGQKKAHYAVHIECNHTRYRNIFKSGEEKFSFEIPSNVIDERVEVCSFILAAKALDKYRNSNSHPDYAKRAFQVRKGDTLAVGLDHEFRAEKKNDPLRKVPSIFSIRQSKDPNATGMDIDLIGAKIQVILSQANFQSYMYLRQNQALHPVLSSSIIVPALVDVLEKLRRAAIENGIGECLERRWFTVLARRLSELGIDPEDPDSFKDSSLMLAHEILGQPLFDSLEALKSLIEEDAE